MSSLLNEFLGGRTTIPSFDGEDGGDDADPLNAELADNFLVAFLNLFIPLLLLPDVLLGPVVGEAINRGFGDAPDGVPGVNITFSILLNLLDIAPMTFSILDICDKIAALAAVLPFVFSAAIAERSGALIFNSGILYFAAATCDKYIHKPGKSSTIVSKHSLVKIRVSQAVTAIIEAAL